MDCSNDPARPPDPFVVSINFSCYLLSVSFIDSEHILASRYGSDEKTNTDGEPCLL